MKHRVRGSAVIFDLDGTLVDSAPDITASIGHALNNVGQPALSLERVRDYIGNGAERLIHRSLTGDPDGVADSELFDTVSTDFFEHYANNVCCTSELYAGVVPTLTRLAQQGYFLACVTNKPSRFTQPLLEKLGIDTFFSITLSGDSLPAKKPSPVQLLYVADRWGITPADCVMVGDSVTDLLAAQNANMPVICVSYGYGDLPDIVAHGPSVIIDSIDQIVDALSEEATAL